MNRSILVFGTQCDFADLVLDRLVRDGFRIVARFIPGLRQSSEPFYEIPRPTRPKRDLQLPLVTTTPRSDSRPDDAGFPTVAINNQDATETQAYIQRLGADLGVVCCYPERLRQPLLSHVPQGLLNIHPSLLPDYRGPEPLFWIYRNGERVSGVTIHEVEPTLDSGPIVAQRQIDVPIGKPGNELWMESARIGADMLIEVLRRNRFDRRPMTPQDESLARYFSWPTSDDLVVNPDHWDAWKLFHFVRGVTPLGYVPIIRTSQGEFMARGATRYTDNDGSDPKETVSGPGERWVTCARGQVLLQL